MARTGPALGWVVLLAVPVLILLLLWGFQRRLIYFPIGTPGSPAASGLPRAEAVQLSTEDGLTLDGWFVPADWSPARATVLICNGNAGHRGMRADIARALTGRGMAVLLFDYRGYAGNPGHPTEEGLIRDARAARAYLGQRDDVDPERIVYLGESLGAAVCLALALEEPPMGLVLRSPFTSMVDVGRHHYPFLPVALLLRDRYASLERIPRVACPVEVVAGDRDGIVPLEQSRQLFEAAPLPGRLRVVPGAGHNDQALVAGAALLEAVDSAAGSGAAPASPPALPLQ